MSESSHAQIKPMLGDRTYNFMKKLVTVGLPALGALYFALAQIWQLPKAEEVVGSIAAVNTFFGMILGLSSKSYNKINPKYAGEIQIEETDEKIVANLVVNGKAEDILKFPEATFKVTEK